MLPPLTGVRGITPESTTIIARIAAKIMLSNIGIIVFMGCLLCPLLTGVPTNCLPSLWALQTVTLSGCLGGSGSGYSNGTLVRLYLAVRQVTI